MTRLQSLMRISILTNLTNPIKELIIDYLEDIVGLRSDINEESKSRINGYI